MNYTSRYIITDIWSYEFLGKKETIEVVQGTGIMEVRYLIWALKSKTQQYGDSWAITNLKREDIKK